MTLFSFIVVSFCFFFTSCTQQQEKIQPAYTITANAPEEEVSGYKLIAKGLYSEQEKAVALSPESSYGFTLEIEPEPDIYYHIKVKVKSEKYSVNLTSESTWQGWYASRIPEIQKGDADWYYIHLLLKSPQSVNLKKLKVYAYHWGTDTSYVDSLQVTEYKEFPFTDTLPDFIFQPLTYQILNELAFYAKEVTISNFNRHLEEPFLEAVLKSSNVPKENYLKEVKRKSRTNQLKQSIDKLVLETNILQHPSVSRKPQDIYIDSLTGYTEKVIYTQGETIRVALQNSKELKSVQLLVPGEDYQFRKIKDIPVQNRESIELVTDELTPGTYCLQLRDNKRTFNIPIIINSKVKSKLVVLAPVVTWHAYNHYDGKSFYVNTLDDSCVYEISTQRPLISCTFDSAFTGHDLFIFQNIYRFFYDNYGGNVYPDSYLEEYPELFDGVTTVVFAQHCEYFSTKMFDALREFSHTKNIISLGGNQAYYKIQFKDNFKTIECRKDGTFFSHSLIPAGTWRTLFSNEAQYLGNAYTDAGYATYNSYRVTESGHWMYKNCNIAIGKEFGQKGMDRRGTSGDEMDKVNERTPKNAVILAKGTNPDNGGGDLLIIENSGNAILSFGSIAAGSGIHYDPVITMMLRNFMQKYHRD